MNRCRPGVRVACVVGAGCLVHFIPGCGLNQKDPAKDTFVLNAGEARAVVNSRPEVLRVESVRVAPPYDERNLVFRTGSVAMNPDYYNVFVADPDDLLTGELVRVVSDSKAFATVVEPGSTATAPLRLDCMVTELYADVREKGKPMAVCRARYRLLRDDPGRTTVAGDWTFEKSVAIMADTGAAAAEGMGKAFGLTIESFVQAAAK